jgi:RND family efflux transporter MFP subunit
LFSVRFAKALIGDWILFLGQYALAALLAGTAWPAAAQSESFDCVIEPRLRLELAAPTAGVLQDVLVDRGDIIHQGETLARLNSTVEEAEVAVYKAKAESEAAIGSRAARVEYLSSKRDRLTKLQSRGAIAQAELDETAADLAVAESDLVETKDQHEIAKLEYERSVAILNQRSIRSPIDGVVVERKLNSGEYAYDQAPILVLADLDPLSVEVYLPTADFHRIRVGMVASIQPSDPIGGEYAATVEIVDTVFDARSGTFGVRLKLPNPGYSIPAGLRCQVGLPGS